MLSEIAEKGVRIDALGDELRDMDFDDQLACGSSDFTGLESGCLAPFDVDLHDAGPDLAFRAVLIERYLANVDIALDVNHAGRVPARDKAHGPCCAPDRERRDR